MHLLVTGAASFIGANFIPMALRKGWKITAAMRNSSEHFENMGIAKLPVKIIEMDISDEANYRHLPDKVDAVVHLAAIRSVESPLEDMILSNVNGSQLISSYAKKAGAKTIIYASTMSVYGDIKVPIVSETTDIINPDPYGLTKYMGEQIFLDKLNEPDYRALAIRLPSVLGKNAPDHWLSQVLTKAMANEDINIFNPSSLFNNAVYIDDLIDFILNTIELDWQGLCVSPLGVKTHMKIREIVNFIAKKLSSKSKIITHKSNSNSFQISNEFVISKFGYIPKNLDETLLNFITHNAND
jgi:nucleoside-diphosphate-sugar epimerase